MKRRMCSEIQLNSGDEENRHPGLTMDEGDSEAYNELKFERRKVRKVLVERKRRERIDRCLDQLKQYLQESHCTGDQPPNLEKADILELTVDHMRTLRSRGQVHRIHGYRACVREVSNFLANSRLDDQLRHRMMQHLATRQTQLVTSDDLHSNENESPMIGYRNDVPTVAGEIISSIPTATSIATASRGAANSVQTRADDVFRFGMQNSTLQQSTRYYNLSQNGARALGARGNMATSIPTASFGPVADNYRKHNLNEIPPPAYGSSWSVPNTINDYTHLSMCNSSSRYEPLTPPPSALRPRALAHQGEGQSRVKVIPVEVIQRSRSVGTPEAVQSSDIDTTSTTTSLDDVSMLSLSYADTSSRRSPVTLEINYEVDEFNKCSSDMGAEKLNKECRRFGNEEAKRYLRVKSEPQEYDSEGMWRPW